MLQIENPYGIPGLPTQVPASYVPHSKTRTIQQLFEQALGADAPLYSIAITCSKGRYTIYDGLLTRAAILKGDFNDPITRQLIDQIYFYAIGKEEGKEGIFRPLFPLAEAVLESIHQREAALRVLATQDRSEAEGQASRLGQVYQLTDPERFTFIQVQIQIITKYALIGLDPSNPQCLAARHIVAVAHQELLNEEQASLWERAYQRSLTVGASSNPNGLRVDASDLR